MDVKNKPGCRCCSPCSFSCIGTFPEIGGFVLSADVAEYVQESGDCSPCYWNLTLPLTDTIEDLSDTGLDVNAECCSFERVYESPCCEHEHIEVSTFDTGWQFWNSTTEQRTVQYFCTKVYVVQRVTVSVKASMCEDFVGGDFINRLHLLVSYKWEFSVRSIGYGQIITYRRPTGGGPESVFSWSHVPVDFFVGPIDTCASLRSYTSDFLAANTSCLCFPSFAPYTTYKDAIEPCDGATYNYFVERTYRIDPVVINDCCDLLGTYNLVFVSVNSNVPGSGIPIIQSPTQTLPGIYSFAGVLNLTEPCIPSNLTAEIYGDGCGDGTCVYEWDGSSWSLLTDGCTSLGCDCPELPTAPGDAPGDQISFPCVNCP